MRATQDILRVWSKFNDVPMETLTKAWFYDQVISPKQRTINLMKEHREQYGTAGNCFDLAIWLLHEFREERMDSYAILTPDSHVAVIVLDEHGQRYLCDLGDQWIEPILIERTCDAFTEEYVNGFFPGASVKLESQPDTLNITYRRPNGKISKQGYSLQPISDEQLIAEGEKTQQILWSPLVEKRIYMQQEVTHWEFDDYKSFISSMEGLTIEQPCHSLEEWAQRISRMSGIHRDVVYRALEVYAKPE